MKLTRVVDVLNNELSMNIILLINTIIGVVLVCHELKNQIFMEGTFNTCK